MITPGASHISRVLDVLQKYGDAVLAISLLVGMVLYVGSVSSKGQETSDRVDKQSEHTIRTEAEFRASFQGQQIQLNELLKTTTRIEQFLKDKQNF
jgi:hypothetical protein